MIKTKVSLATDANAENIGKNNEDKISLASDAEAAKIGKKYDKDKSKPGH